MRSKIIILLVSAIVSGCKMNDFAPCLIGNKVFYATIENNYETKTSLDQNGNVLWKRGDQVSIFAGNTINAQYQVTESSDGRTSAEMIAVGGDSFVAGTEINNNVAIYPYTEGNSIAKNGDDYEINYTLPSTQNYEADSFGNGSFPMVAVSSSTSDKNLSFKNVLGALTLKLKGTAVISSISLTGNNDEILYGVATLTASNGNTPTITLKDDSAKIVTLDCGTGVQLNTTTATSFTIALPPMTMSSGFTVTVVDTDNKQMEISTSKSQTIGRSNRLVMPDINYEGTAVGPVYEAVDLGLSVLWATCNVGASSPEGYGDYFAWGATEPWYEDGYAQEDPQDHWKTGKSNGYCWDNAPYQTVKNPTSYDYARWTKYLGSTSSTYKSSQATDTDARKKVLDPEDDAAYVNWSGNWRMPTETELAELLNKSNCTFTNATINEVKGVIIQSKIEGYTDKWIFLPAAGMKRDAYNTSGVGDYCYYWSSSLSQNHPSYAGAGHYEITFVNPKTVSGYRSDGRTIRPVKSK